jgi:hypothetical protein
MAALLARVGLFLAVALALVLTVALAGLRIVLTGLWRPAARPAVLLWVLLTLATALALILVFSSLPRPAPCGLGGAGDGGCWLGRRTATVEDAQLAALLRDRPQDAVALVGLMQANPRLLEELQRAPRFVDPVSGREAAIVTMWVK